MNFFLADVQTGVGPFLAIYLAGYGWNEQRVGIALTVGGIAGILAQTPAGAFVDRVHCKRALIVAEIVALAVGRAADCARANVLVGHGAQILIGGTSSIFIPALCAISLRLPVRSCIILISTWAFSSLLPSQRRHSAFSTLSCPRHVINTF